MINYKELIDKILEFKPNASFSIRYIDNPENQWSVPVLLKKKDYQVIMTDTSIDGVKFINKNGTTTICLR